MQKSIVRRFGGLSGGAVIFALSAPAACSPTPRDFDPPDAGSGGSAGSGDAGSGGESASGGSSGTGGSAGSSGQAGDGGCPAGSCCIDGTTYSNGQKNPSNACQGCKSNLSSSSWSARDGEVCLEAAAQSVAPKIAFHITSSCGESGCANHSAEAEAEVLLRLAAVQPVDALSLDFANLRPSPALNVSKALLRFFVKAASTAPKAKVTAPGLTTELCWQTITATSYQKMECDVTSLVRGWLSAPESSARTLEITVMSAGQGITVTSPKFSDENQRPVLILDYSASCTGTECVTLLR